ncbi:Cytoplasmic tRNA 2-thiolation protein 2 [Savitreella phatthalungensis]
MTLQSPSTETKACRRCKASEHAGPLYPIRRNFLCGTCTRDFVETKYLATFESWRRANLVHGKDTAQVLVGVSGGLGSTVLCALLCNSHRATNGKAPKPVAVHLREPRDPVTGIANLQWLHETYPELEIVEREPKLAPATSDAGTQTDAVGDPFADVLAALGTPTARDDLSWIARHQTLSRIAQELGCAVVCTGETSTRCASMTLSLAAQGRGDAVVRHASESWHDSATGIWHTRFVKRLLTSELIEYARIRGMYVPESGRRPGEIADAIDRLTIDYFADLEPRFPSLVDTVSRATDKLTEDISTGSTTACTICGIATDPAAPEWATGATIASLGGDSPLTQSATDLCYGCMSTLRDARTPMRNPSTAPIAAD